MLFVCSIGCHSVFVNIAEIHIGIYVNINSGNVKVYNIFFRAGHIMSCHSEITVMSPNRKSVIYRVPDD